MTNDRHARARSFALQREINADEIKNLTDNYCLVIFSSSTCKPCLNVKAAFAYLKEERGKAYPLYTVPVAQGAESTAIFEEFRLRIIPTLILYAEGIEMKRWGGFFEDEISIAAEKMAALLDKAIDELPKTEKLTAYDDASI